MLSRFRLHARLRSLFGNSRLEDKMAEELRFHLVLATLVLITVAGLAGYLPASRAARVDPMDALRNE